MEKFWEPVDELMLMALDVDSEPMRDDPEVPQVYGATVIGFDLDDPEGCRSILTVTGEFNREDDKAFAELIIAGLQRVALPT
jgi:hypothetical protein